ncbi:TIGR04500 family putative peptide maturation system protein [Kineococcus sp. SYSU DK002]|uniref:TIGR04500 family putative peptide maturation system protein n=1 Tax=Kineococcus sp. SYSU DK002 TaxID=3383123 RepID=UPI003D7D3AC6
MTTSALQPPPTHPSALDGDVLASAVELLRGLPRRRGATAAAHAAVSAWAAAHPAARAELVVDERPGTVVVDNDLLLTAPGGGTIALSVSDDDGRAWLVDHSTHWAADVVVSVDDEHITVPQAMTMLRGIAERNATVLEHLVDQCLLMAEARADGGAVDARELQEAVDAMRRARGLLTRESVLAWMRDAGLTPEQVERTAHDDALRRRARRRLEQQLAEEHLARHRTDFDRVLAARLTGPSLAAPATVAAAALDGKGVEAALHVLTAAATDLPGTELVVGEGFAGRLPAAFRAAAAGDLVGPVPVEDGEGEVVGLVVRRSPAVHDRATLDAAGQAALSAWLATRRAAATTTWHWL